MQVLFTLLRGLGSAMLLAGAVLFPGPVFAQHIKLSGDQPQTFLGSPTAYDAGVFFLPAAPSDPMPAFRQLISAKYGKWSIVDAFPKPIDRAMITVRWERDVPHHYPAPTPDAMRFYARGLTKVEGASLSSSQEALVLSFAWPTNWGLSYLRETEEILSDVATQYGGVISDDETREFFSAKQWQDTRLAGWEGDLPLVKNHITIHAYNHGSGARAVTLGMAKFGLPDLVVESFSWSVARPMLQLVYLFGQSLMEHNGEGYIGNFDVDLSDFKYSTVKDSQAKVLKDRPVKIAHLYLNKGQPDAGDPQNNLLVIGFDRYQGDDVFAKEQQCLNGLFAFKENLHMVENDEAMQRASAAARARLPEMRQLFEKGLAAGEQMLVKAPFYNKAKEPEFMWVNVTSWTKDEIKGILTNEPVMVANLHAGQTVTVPEAEVYDFFHRKADGTEEGGATDRLLMPPKKEEPKK